MIKIWDFSDKAAKRQYMTCCHHVELLLLAQSAPSGCGQAQVEAFSQERSQWDPLLSSRSQTERSDQGQVVKTGVNSEQTPSVTSTHT